MNVNSISCRAEAKHTASTDAGWIRKMREKKNALFSSKNRLKRWNRRTAVAIWNITDVRWNMNGWVPKTPKSVPFITVIAGRKYADAADKEELFMSSSSHTNPLNKEKL